MEHSDCREENHFFERMVFLEHARLWNEEYPERVQHNRLLDNRRRSKWTNATRNFWPSNCGQLAVPRRTEQ
jgi:hypothetical protein